MKRWLMSELPQEIKWQYFRRSVVREVLRDVSEYGLPAGVEITLAFVTDYPGVQLPADVVKNFPDKIRIAFRQGYFWNLHVSYTEISVEVTLGTKQRIVIPCAALTGFYIPASGITVEMMCVPSEFAGRLMPNGVVDCTEQRAS